MKIIKVEKENIANGPGIRTVIWVGGCEHHCSQCHNPETWSFDVGEDLTEDTINEIIEATKPDYISGITFTGGDPFALANRVDTLELVERLRKVFPNKSIWMWTGYSFEEIYVIPGMECFDVIVDGKFEVDKMNLTLPWRGSSNQRVIDVKRSLLEKKVINYME